MALNDLIYAEVSLTKTLFTHSLTHHHHHHHHHHLFFSCSKHGSHAVARGSNRCCSWNCSCNRHLIPPRSEAVVSVCRCLKWERGWLTKEKHCNHFPSPPILSPKPTEESAGATDSHLLLDSNSNSKLRDSSITSRIRTPSLYPRPATRTNATLPLYTTLY